MVFSDLDAEHYHLAQLHFVVLLTIMNGSSNEGSTFVIAAVGHCGKNKNGGKQYHKSWMLALAKASDKILIKYKGRLVIIGFVTDGWSVIRKIKKLLSYSSGEEISIPGLKFIPCKTIAPLFATCSDIRHNVKCDYRKIYLRGIVIGGVRITTDIVKKFGVNLFKTFGIKYFPFNSKRWMYLCDEAYKSDPMNVINALHFFKGCYIIGSNHSKVYESLARHRNSNQNENENSNNNNNDNTIIDEFRTKYGKKLCVLSVWSQIRWSYICSLFDREVSWNNILYLLSFTALGNYIGFCVSGNTFMASQTFYEENSTAKGMLQIVQMMQDLSNKYQIIKNNPKEYPLYIHLVQVLLFSLILICLENNNNKKYNNISESNK